MKLGQPTFVNEPWTRRNAASWVSPSISGSWEQIMLFPEKGGDYTITFRMTLLDGQRTGDFQYREAGVVFRYNDLNRFYYAGVGGFNARRFIGVVEDNHGERAWQFLSKEGDLGGVALLQQWDLKVECLGRRIQLYEGESPVLSTDDAVYRGGNWGFRTVRTQALFEDIKITPARKPRCFVVMPFSPPFDFIYAVIKAEVEDHGYLCLREDECNVAKRVMEDLKLQLASADLIIADLSNARPNVYYEVGLAHSLGKKVILLAQSERDVAFNLRDIRYDLYQTPQELQLKLQNALRQITEELEQNLSALPSIPEAEARALQP